MKITLRTKVVPYYAGGEYDLRKAKPTRKAYVTVYTWQWWLYCLFRLVEYRFKRWIGRLDNQLWDITNDCCLACGDRTDRLFAGCCYECAKGVHH